MARCEKNRFQLEVEDQYWDPTDFEKTVVAKTGKLSLVSEESHHSAKKGAKSHVGQSAGKKGQPNVVKQETGEEKSPVSNIPEQEDMTAVTKTVEESDDDWIKATKAKGRRKSKIKNSPRSKVSPTGQAKHTSDRQSGSGRSLVRHVDKKGGGGAHNWGRPDDNLEASFEIFSPEVTPELKAQEFPKSVMEDFKKSNHPEAASYRDVVTFKEWKDQSQQDRPIPKHKVRKAGEGENLNQWGDFSLLRKKPANEDLTEDAHCAAQKPVEKACPRPKKKGGDRGWTRPHVSTRASELDHEPPNLDDSDDFPELGK